MTVYFLRPVGERGPIKIGVTANLESRMRVVATWTPWPVECVATYSGGQEVEARFHRLFSAHRQHNEWFRAADEIDAAIEAINAGTFEFPIIPQKAVTPRPRVAPKRSNLREYRKLYGVTLEALARKVGISHAQLSRIEHGWTPSFKTAARLSEVTGLPLETFLPVERSAA